MPDDTQPPNDDENLENLDDLPQENEANILPINVADEVKNSFLDYSMSVIISRALPDARDGLKPSQRRLLYAMHRDLSLGPNKKPLKCARIVGETMGKYHPHGDQAIYPTLVNMAQPWSMREILVEGQGNFGSVEGDPPAAMRYTEAKLTHLGTALMNDMEKGTVDFVANYDDTNHEPTVLPASFPNLLVNGGTGIAVGMATNIPPHNLVEVIAGICAQIDNPEISIDELMTYITAPDFPTGCTILGYQGVRSYMHTGRGSVRVRGIAEVVEAGRKEQIIISEIPYMVNRATLVARIAELVNEKIVTEISGVRDESDENTRVVIDLKRDARPQVVLNLLYKHTQLETSFSVNMLAIDNRRPKLLNLKEALTCYIEHRREVIVRRTRFLLAEAEKKAEGLEALLIAVSNLDDFIKMVRGSANRDEAFGKIKAYAMPVATVEGYGVMLRDQASIQGGNYVFTDAQVNRILEMRLYQLTALERDKIKANYDEILAEIKELMAILASEARVLQIIKDELTEIKDRFGSPRKTRIEADPGEIATIDLIANDAQIITISHRGYIKRTAAEAYKAQKRGGRGVLGMGTREVIDKDEDEEDFVEHLFSATAHDYLMFFTNTGRVFVERVFLIPEMSRQSKGRSIKNLLNLLPDEKIASYLRVEGTGEDDRTTFDQPFNVLFATRSGKVKKTALHEFRNYRKQGTIAIKIEEGNELISVKLTTGSDDICLITSGGYCVRCNESTIRTMGRNSSGVRGIRPREGDHLVALVVVTPDMQMLIASERGQGKRTAFEEYMTKGRGGKGMIAMKITEKTGRVVEALAVAEDDEIMLITNGGQSVRTRVAEVRSMGRSTQGVRLIGVREGALLQDVARVVADEEEEGDAVPDTDAPGDARPPTANPAEADTPSEGGQE